MTTTATTCPDCLHDQGWNGHPYAPCGRVTHRAASPEGIKRQAARLLGLADPEHGAALAYWLGFADALHHYAPTFAEHLPILEHRAAYLLGHRDGDALPLR